ncbi:DUF697 domain-containing protein [Tissierella creatinini]|nr:DUF697 domain-containing protein [Tissierella creatinini]TJX67299.1 DUF697 domain-containing protein [Soehngenia saccharolytica]
MDKTNSLDKKPYKTLIVTVATIFLISFAIIMINQVSQLVQTATAVHPILGQILLLFFILLFIIGIMSIVGIMITLDKPLVIPDVDDGDSYSAFIEKLKKRLIKNKFLKSSNFIWNPEKEDINQVEEALDLLNKESLKIIKRESSAVFITTAVSQNGSLDSIFVFISAARLIWQIAMLYNQRPAISDLTKLYSNVLGTVLLSRQIDDLDLLSEQLEPVISSIFGGSVGSIVPGVSFAATFIVDSLIEGSINALLMLRVGIITQRYLSSMTKVDNRTIGKSATIEACSLLGTLITDNSKRIVDAIYNSIKNATADAIRRGKKSIFDNLKIFINKEMQ